jgi:hypothetical protein
MNQCESVSPSGVRCGLPKGHGGNHQNGSRCKRGPAVGPEGEAGMTWFHFHKWITRKSDFIIVKQPRVLGGVPMLGEPYAEWPESLILQGCECGKFRVERLRGHWSVEDLAAESSPEKGDRNG